MRNYAFAAGCAAMGVFQHNESQLDRIQHGEVLAKRKSGSIIHVMKLTAEGYAPATGAICGTVAQDSRYSSMSRAGWYQMKVGDQPTCKKCLAILVERWREANPAIAAVWEKKYEG